MFEYHVSFVRHEATGDIVNLLVTRPGDETFINVNELGREGWELLGLEQGGYTASMAVFKRPIKNPSVDLAPKNHGLRD